MSSSAHRANKRARFEDREAVGSDNDSEDQEEDPQGSQYSETGIDDGSQDNDTSLGHMQVDNMDSQQEHGDGDDGDGDDGDGDDGDGDDGDGDECEEVWGFSSALISIENTRRLVDGGDEAAVQSMFMQVYYGLMRWCEGDKRDHGSEISMLLHLCSLDTGFYDRATVDQVTAHFETMRDQLEPLYPGPFTNDDDDELGWDDLIERVLQMIDIVCDIQTTARRRIEKVHKDDNVELSTNQKLMHLVVTHMHKLDIYVSVGDFKIYRKLPGNAKFELFQTGNDTDIGRPVTDFHAMLRKLRSSNQVKKREMNPDQYDLVAMLSKNLGEEFINNFAKYFVTSDNTRVLRKRINFIRFADFAIDQNTMQVYTDDDIGKTWFPYWNYLDICFADVSHSLAEFENIDQFGEDHYEFEEDDPLLEERKQWRRKQHVQRLEHSREFEDDLLIWCDEDGVPCNAEDTTHLHQRVIWPQKSRHLFRIFEDQQWSLFAMRFRMVLISRSFFWHFVDEPVINLQDDVPQVGDGGDSSSAVPVDYGESGAGKSTISNFINVVNGDLSKNIRCEGVDATFFASQVADGATLNIVLDELSANCQFPAHDWLQMCGGAKADANRKHEQRLAKIQWIYSMSMICNFNQFPESLTDDIVRVARRTWPFIFKQTFAFKADESLGGNVTKHAGHIHLESLMHRKIFRLDCEKMQIPPNYTEWVKRRDTERFMHNSRIKFFEGIRTAPHMQIFSSQNFQWEWDQDTDRGFYTLLESVASTPAYKAGYGNQLKNYVARIGREIFEEELENCDCADEAMTKMTDRLGDSGFGIKFNGRAMVEQIANADISVTITSIEDYCNDGKYRQHFKDDLKCSQAASIFFQKDVKVLEREEFWPPGQTTLKLKAKYLLGCAAANQVQKFRQAAACDEEPSHKVRLLLVSSNQPSYRRLEYDLEASQYRALKEFHSARDVFRVVEYSKFEEDMEDSLQREVDSSEEWSDDFENAERLMFYFYA